MRSYGFVGGKSVYAFSNVIVKEGVDGNISQFWTYIDDLQRQLVLTKGMDITQLEKIVILDEGIFEERVTTTEVQRRLIDLIKLQRAVKDYAYGVNIVVLTSSRNLYNQINQYMDVNPTEVYEGFYIEFTKDDQVTVEDVVAVFNRSYEGVGVSKGRYGTEENSGMTEEEMLQEIEEQTYLAELISERDTLLDLKRVIERKIEDVLYDLESVLPVEDIQEDELYEDEYEDVMRSRKRKRRRKPRRESGTRPANRREDDREGRREGRRTEPERGQRGPERGSRIVESISQRTPRTPKQPDKKQNERNLDALRELDELSDY